MVGTGEGRVDWILNLLAKEKKIGQVRKKVDRGRRRPTMWGTGGETHGKERNKRRGGPEG